MVPEVDSTDKPSYAGFFRMGGIFLSIVGGLVIFVILYVLFGRREPPESAD